MEIWSECPSGPKDQKNSSPAAGERGERRRKPRIMLQMKDKQNDMVAIVTNATPLNGVFYKFVGELQVVQSSLEKMAIAIDTWKTTTSGLSQEKNKKAKAHNKKKHRSEPESCSGFR